MTRTLLLLFSLLLFVPATGEATTPAPPPPRPTVPKKKKIMVVPSVPSKSMASGQTILSGKVTVTLMPQMIKGHPEHGYVFYKVQIQNDDSRSHSIRFAFESNPTHSYPHIKQITKQTESAAKTKSLVSILHPALRYRNPHIVVYIDNQKAGVLRLFGSMYMRSYKRLRVLVSRRVSYNVLDAVNRSRRLYKRYHAGHRYRHRYRAVAKAPGPSVSLSPAVKHKMLALPRAGFTRGQFSASRTELEPSQWSRSWLAYTGYAGLLLHAETIARMPTGVRDAVMRYLEAGGVVAIVGDWKPPKGWRSAPLRSDEEGPWTHYSVGFGSCYVYTKKAGMDLIGKDPTVWRAVLKGWHRSVVPFRTTMTPQEANRRFPVLDNIGVPVRGIFFLMLLFSMLLGPLNMFVLWRMKKRIWLLWTVPVGALLSCMAILAYASLSGGWGSHLRLASVTYLDQSKGRAVTLGWAGFYSSATLSQGLPFDFHTEITPQIRSYYRGGRGRGLSLDLTREQRLTSGWVLSRVPLHLQLRTHQQRREKLVFRQQGGSMSVINGLGATLKRLVVRDHSGRLYTNKGPIKAGAKASLFLDTRSTGGSSTPPTPGWRIYKSMWKGLSSPLKGKPWFQAVLNFPGSYIEPGGYLAEMEAAPFISKRIQQGKEVNAHSIVIGRWEARHGS